MKPEFKVFNTEHKHFIVQSDEHRRDYVLTYWETHRRVGEPRQYIGLKDKNGRKIYADSEIVKFKLMTGLRENTELIGVFTFHGDELRYEIDIYNHSNYTVLSYISNGQMYDFEVIGTVEENPELITAQTKS